MELVGINWQQFCLHFGVFLVAFSMIVGFGLGTSDSPAAYRAAAPVMLGMMGMGGVLLVLAIAGVWR